MSNNQNEAVTKAMQGVLPATSRALVLRDGTIANAHFLGIPFNAPNAAGAMVVANFLLSPEAQLEKQRPTVWADGTVLQPGAACRPNGARGSIRWSTIRDSFRPTHCAATRVRKCRRAITNACRTIGAV